jgi:hypothetical protein
MEGNNHVTHLCQASVVHWKLFLLPQETPYSERKIILHEHGCPAGFGVHRRRSINGRTFAMKESIAHSGAWGIAAIMIVVTSWVLYSYLAPKTWREWALTKFRLEFSSRWGNSRLRRNSNSSIRRRSIPCHCRIDLSRHAWC